MTTMRLTPSIIACGHRCKAYDSFTNTWRSSGVNQGELQMIGRAQRGAGIEAGSASGARIVEVDVLAERAVRLHRREDLRRAELKDVGELLQPDEHVARCHARISFLHEHLVLRGCRAVLLGPRRVDDQCAARVQ